MKKDLITDVVFESLLWILLLVPYFTVLFAFISIPVGIYELYRLIKSYRENPNRFRRLIFVSPLSVLALFGILHAGYTYLAGEPKLFYGTPTLYRNNFEFGSDANIDPTYRVHYYDMRGKTNGLLLSFPLATPYYYVYNDLALKAIITIFGFPRGTYDGHFPDKKEITEIFRGGIDSMEKFTVLCENPNIFSFIYKDSVINIYGANSPVWHGNSGVLIFDTATDEVKYARLDSQQLWSEKKKSNPSWYFLGSAKYHPLIIALGPVQPNDLGISLNYVTIIDTRRHSIISNFTMTFDAK